MIPTLALPICTVKRERTHENTGEEEKPDTTIKPFLFGYFRNESESEGRSNDPINEFGVVDSRLPSHDEVLAQMRVQTVDSNLINLHMHTHAPFRPPVLFCHSAHSV